MYLYIFYLLSYLDSRLILFLLLFQLHILVSRGRSTSNIKMNKLEDNYENNRGGCSFLENFTNANALYYDESCARG